MSVARFGVKLASGVYTGTVVQDDSDQEWDVEAFVRRTGRRWYGRKYQYKEPLPVGGTVKAGERIGMTVVGKRGA